MPAKSKAQQRYMAMVAHGKIKGPKGLSKEEARKMAKTKHDDLPERVTEASLKQLVEGMTFSSFLLAEAAQADPNTLRGYIQSLETYQELKGSDETRGQAIKLASQLMKEIGDGPIDQATKDYVFDQFDEISQGHFRGTSMGDWAGEEEYQRREEEDKEIESAVDKWEQSTGMDAVTGKEKKRRISGARTGMDYEAEKKAARAKSQLAAFADAPAAEQGARLASAKTRAGAATAPARGDKMTAARAIFSEDFGEKRPSEIIRRMMDEAGMSKPHATTYYYKFKKAAAQ